MSEDPISEDQFYVNGIHASTGTYIEDPLTYNEVAEFAWGEKLSDERFNALQKRVTRAPSRGIVKGLDECDLKEAGWGIIYPTNTYPPVMEALNKLVLQRQEDTGGLCRVYDDYQPNESWDSFHKRHQVGTGLADPAQMPYYILLVGDPETIPYSFQYDIGVERAVGRIYFKTAEEYARYADSVVQAAQGKLVRPKRATIFATQHPGDGATILSSEHLAAPLYQSLAKALAGEWQIGYVPPGQAEKRCLTGLLGGAETPALLFTATHGAGFNKSDLRFSKHQGALVTQDWPGPKAMLPLDKKHYVSAEDVTDEASVGGMIALFFACFSAGTPKLNDFYHHRERDPNKRMELSDQAMLSPLPLRLLSHPRGGALAVVGHIDRAWDASFRMLDKDKKTIRDYSAMMRVIRALARGVPLGPAMEEISARYAQFSTSLVSMIYNLQRAGLLPDDASKRELANLWTANNDARNYIILGDPAVRLSVAKNGSERVSTSAEISLGEGPISGDGAESSPTNPSAAGAAGHSSSRPSSFLADTVDEPSPEPSLTQEKDANGSSPFAIPSGAYSVRGMLSIQPEPEPEVDEFASFSPLPAVPEGYKEKYPELYSVWVEHIQTGYQNNSLVFRRILDAFISSHYSTVIMNWIVFLIGVGFFITAGILALVRGQPVAGALFGGLSVLSFLAFFISRPSQAVEENLEFVTWLGLIYTSYWTHQALSFDQATAQEELNQATEAAFTQMKELIDRHAQAVRDRPGLFVHVKKGERDMER